MSDTRPATLRNVLSVSAVMVTLLATTAAIALVLATSVLERMTSDIAEAVESVRLIDEAEVTLLLHVRAGGRENIPDVAGQVRSLLDEAAEYARLPQEREVLAEAQLDVTAYFQLANDPTTSPGLLKAHEELAIDALERLGDLEVIQTRSVQDRVSRWEYISRITGIVLACSIVLIALVVVLWLRRRVIRPLFSLADTVKRFGDGDRAARAVEDGPTELREMTRNFNEMADAIAARRQAQVAFLGGVAHDLRNPLYALKLAVDVLSPSQPLPPEAQLRRTLAVIARQINQLERQVGDFLDMEKIEAGELELSIAEHDVRTIVGESIELFAETSRSRLKLTMPDGPVVVAADAVRIGQVVTNLVSNAIKYSPPDEPIDITVGATREEVTIEVTDRGVGIPHGDHRKIFEPFRRGPTRNTVPGTGLGLYNVQRIVEAHAGRIEVDSVPSVGSTFRIKLACGAAGSADPPADRARDDS